MLIPSIWYEWFKIRGSCVTSNGNIRIGVAFSRILVEWTVGRPASPRMVYWRFQPQHPLLATIGHKIVNILNLVEVITIPNVKICLWENVSNFGLFCFNHMNCNVANRLILENSCVRSFRVSYLWSHTDAGGSLFLLRQIIFKFSKRGLRTERLRVKFRTPFDQSQRWILT